MKTSDLIAALAADPVPAPIRLDRRFAGAVLSGFAGALVLYALIVGPRPDLLASFGTVRFDLKFLVALALALPAILLVARLQRPDAKAGWLAAWLAAPLVLLAVAVAVELAVVPRDLWLPRLVGRNALWCLVMIPMMAAPILAALIAALAAAAPRRPGWTGALAGAAAAGLAAFLYASHCPDDSPLFVATWYPLATLVCAAAGAWAGRRFLAW